VKLQISGDDKDRKRQGRLITIDAVKSSPAKERGVRTHFNGDGKGEKGGKRGFEAYVEPPQGLSVSSGRRRGWTPYFPKYGARGSR